MSATEYRQTRSPEGATSNGVSRDRLLRETKPWFKTTEFWAMLVGVAAVVVIYNASDDPSLNLFRASLLATLLAISYIASRGIAKNGVRDTRVFDDDRYSLLGVRR